MREMRYIKVVCIYEKIEVSLIRKSRNEEDAFLFKAM
jgi:hypothetical protein